MVEEMILSSDKPSLGILSQTLDDASVISKCDHFSPDSNPSNNNSTEHKSGPLRFLSHK